MGLYCSIRVVNEGMKCVVSELPGNCSLSVNKLVSMGKGSIQGGHKKISTGYLQKIRIIKYNAGKSFVVLPVRSFFPLLGTCQRMVQRKYE